MLRFLGFLAVFLPAASAWAVCPTTPTDCTTNQIPVTGWAGIQGGPWTTATRPASPATGATGFNSTLGTYETWNGSQWYSAPVEVNVISHGADPGGTNDSYPAFQAAAASVASGATVNLIVPAGTYKLLTTFQGNGRVVTVSVAGGTVFTGTSPTFFGPRVETLSNLSRQLAVVLYDTSSGITGVLGNKSAQEIGSYAPPLYALAYDYTGIGAAITNQQIVTDSRLYRYDNITAPLAVNIGAEFKQVLFPLPGGSPGQGGVAEWNPTNRSGDPGWSATFGGISHFGGQLITPEVDTITGGTLYGYHTEFGFAITPSSHTNNLGYNPGTYNGFVAYQNSIAPGGDAAFYYGDTTGTLANYPYAPLRMAGNWLHGMITDSSFVSHDGLIISTQTGNGVGWGDGTATANVNGAEISAGNIDVTLTPAGTGRVVAKGSLALPRYTIAAGASQIPACSTALKGTMVYVTDYSGSPTYNGAIGTGGGSSGVPVACDGSAWTTH